MPPSDPPSPSVPSTLAPSVESADPPHRELHYDDVLKVLEVAIREPPGLTLIGGQALNYWAERYIERSQALQGLARLRQFTSGDLDFVGTLAQRPTRDARDAIDVAGELAVAEKIARAIHGRFEKVGPYGPRATLAAVQYRDDQDPPGAEPRVIHFLGDMIGVTPVEVARTAVVVDGNLRVMNAVLSMESRISNVLSSANYQNEKGRHQARVSIPCAREFVLELLENGQVEKVLEFNERIFDFARRRAKGCAKEGFRPAEALVVDERLPERFRTIRYPQMQRVLQQLDLARGRGP